jgi:predicted DCC family thiol-disulfide oxidoreductase YuxK
LAERGIESVSSHTLYLFENGKLYKKSRAALKLIAYLKGPFGLLKILYVFPRFFRDFVYDRIAANRKVFFKDVCELISFDKNRFL